MISKASGTIRLSSCVLIHDYIRSGVTHSTLPLHAPIGARSTHKKDLPQQVHFVRTQLPSMSVVISSIGVFPIHQTKTGKNLHRSIQAYSYLGYQGLFCWSTVASNHTYRAVLSQGFFTTFFLPTRRQNV